MLEGDIIPLVFLAVLVDVLFLTIFYHKKYTIKKYVFFVLVLSLVNFAHKMLFESMFSPLLVSFFVGLALLISTKDKKSLAWFSVPMIFLFFIDILTYETLFVFGFSYVHIYLINIFTKLLLVTFCLEMKELNLIGKLENFTIKTLVFLFVFAHLLFGAYFI